MTIKDLQKSTSSVAEMVLDHHLALNFLLAEQGGVGAVANLLRFLHSYLRDGGGKTTKYNNKQNGLRNRCYSNMCHPKYGAKSRYGCHLLPGFFPF
jgi:hypothetical protein